jgi:hypothetical protein
MIDDDFHQTVFRVHNNIHYHSFRSRFFNLWDKTISFLIIILGSSVVSDFPNPISIYIGFFIAFLGTAQVVYDFRGSCGRHEWSRKKYHELLSKINSSLQKDEKAAVEFRNEIINISIDEPPALKLLEYIAHNRTVDALGYPKDERFDIPYWKKLLSDYISFENFAPEKQKNKENIQILPPLTPPQATQHLTTPPST